MLQDRLQAAAARTRARLLAERTADAGWRGELSSSALSTATALLALLKIDATGSQSLIQQGLQWLLDQQWPSGGWGDTDRSLPNISTTLLAWAALGAANLPADHPAVVQAEAWIHTELGTLEPRALAAAILARYGKDQTFSVPILMACALGNRLGPSPACWEFVPQLPCELAAFPRQWFAALQLPVVSYALPALIAIGQARHFHLPKGTGLLRSLTKQRVFRLLLEIQPASGGYLEATPLTSFVAMALGSMGQAEHPVALAARKFLHASIRPDGGWPIDTDLATWVTTLAVKALSPERPADGENWRLPTLQWLLSQQTQGVHPFTCSAPGAWGWSDLSGSVPDADDTSGALIALKSLDPTAIPAGTKAVKWLLDLQNRDGGLPTFCHGWGALPFDRSTPELTAHALQAWSLWERQMPVEIQLRLQKAKRRALAYLQKSQAADGSWTPLWFGQERGPNEQNNVYGTATVLQCLLKAGGQTPVLAPAANYLAKAAQQPLWPWGIEETSVTLSALRSYGKHPAAVSYLQEELLVLTKDGTEFPSSPIGLYFARLWYYERLYPLVWSLGAFVE